MKNIERSFAKLDKKIQKLENKNGTEEEETTEEEVLTEESTEEVVETEVDDYSQ
jgi:hypothetical protein